MATEIAELVKKLSALCDTYGVIRLEVFGSGARQYFHNRQSDFDLSVNFTELHSLGLFDRYFGLKVALEQLLQCSVDLVEVKEIKNPSFSQAIDQERVFVYGLGN